MSKANGIPPATDRQETDTEVSWRDDPSVQGWGDMGAAGRRPLPATVASAVAGLRAEEVAVVLVDGRPLVLPVSCAVALASGYTVLDSDPALLMEAGVVLDDEPSDHRGVPVAVRAADPVSAFVDRDDSIHGDERSPPADPPDPPLPDQSADRPVDQLSVQPHWPVAEPHWTTPDRTLPATLPPPVHPGMVGGLELADARRAEWELDEVLRTPRVRARGVVRRLHGPAGAVRVLDGIDFEISPGEMVAIDAAAGAGVSTLLACLAGLDEVDAGEVAIEGKSLARLTDAERAYHRGGGIGYVPQENDLVELFTAVENVELPLLSAGWSGRDARAEAVCRLESLGLADHAASRPAQLSVSQRRCVLVARALAGDRLILLADHPTAHLDDDQVALVVSALAALRRGGGSIVLATRDPRLDPLADRRLTLRGGHLHRVIPTA